MISTTTVANALKNIAPGLQLTVTDNRDELIRHLNFIRSLLYSDYQAYEIAVDRKVCLPIVRYHLDCNPCKTTYNGITLPYDAASSESLKIYDQSIRRNSGYKNIPSCGRCIEAWDVIGRFPTQIEVDPSCPGILGVYSSDQRDDGLSVKVTFLDSEGDERVDTISLPGETSLSATRVLSVALPEGRKGKVSIYAKGTGSKGDTILSTYHSAETAPSYTRIRISPDQCKTCIQVDAVYAREFFPVYDDDELVETSNPFVLGELAAFVRINGRGNNSGTDRQEAQVHRVQATNAIKGLIERDEGVSRDVTLKIHGTLSERSGLASRRFGGRYHW